MTNEQQAELAAAKKAEKPFTIEEQKPFTIEERIELLKVKQENFKQAMNKCLGAIEILEEILNEK
jgi:hypothetical protein